MIRYFFGTDLKYKLILEYLLVSFLLFSTLFCRPYLLVVSFDGFRHDYLDRVKTHNFDEIIKKGSSSTLISVFPSLTFPNHYSIATGTYAGTHGIVANSFYRKDYNEIYSYRDKSTVIDGKWYGAEPIWVTAERQGIKSATYFWVGSEAEINGFRPSIYKNYNNDVTFQERLDTVFDWFSLPLNDRPQLCMLYFNEPDHSGHKYGPESSEVDNAVIEMDKLLGIITKKINSLPIKDSLNLVVLSDHGMTTIDSKKFIFLDKHINGINDLRVDGYGPISQLFLHPTKISRKKSVFKQLLRIPNINAYLKKDIPQDYKIINENTGDFLIVADEGWSIFKNKKQSTNFNPIGMHGYNPSLESMKSIFIAYGPQIRSDFKLDPIENVNIYPLFCELLGIKPYSGSQGNLFEISKILK